MPTESHDHKPGDEWYSDGTPRDKQWMPEDIVNEEIAEEPLAGPEEVVDAQGDGFKAPVLGSGTPSSAGDPQKEMLDRLYDLVELTRVMTEQLVMMNQKFDDMGLVKLV